MMSLSALSRCKKINEEPFGPRRLLLERAAPAQANTLGAIILRPESISELLR